MTETSRQPAKLGLSKRMLAFLAKGKDRQMPSPTRKPLEKSPPAYRPERLLYSGPLAGISEAEERDLDNGKKRLAKGTMQTLLKNLDTFTAEKTEKGPEQWHEKVRAAEFKVDRIGLEGRVYEQLLQ